MKTLIRNSLLAFLLSFGFINVKAQYVTIPDPDFVSWLNTHGYTNCMSGNQMDTTCLQVVNATDVNCNNSSIADLTGITYFDNLTNLSCYNNQLTSLPALPFSLIYLYCWDNQLAALPSLPGKLKELRCYSNPINSINFLPDSLNFLDCSGTNLTELPSLPLTLNHILINNCAFDSLPPLPDSLQTLYCNSNNLTSLPPLPATLQWFDCSNNQLTFLPSLPDTLQDLLCYNNLLTSLPTMPKNLMGLNCGFNLLTSLPPLPNSLNNLFCYYNQLTSIPPIPSIMMLYCGHNQLTVLPELPAYMWDLHIDNNVNLTCLPPDLVQLGTFEWANTGINCLPNFLNITSYAQPDISSLYLCEFYNNNYNNCGVNKSINGRIFSDENINCIEDSTDHGLKFIKLKLYSNNQLIKQTISDWQGRFSFSVDSGIYSYFPDSTLYYDIVCPDSGYRSTYISNSGTVVTHQDFGLKCTNKIDIGVHSTIATPGTIRPGNQASIIITAGDMSAKYNLACASGVSGTLKVILNGPASYIGPLSGSLTPSINGDTLLYFIPDYGLVNMKKDFGILILVDTSAQLGEQICLNVFADTVTGDIDTSNNYYSHCYPVVNSYDPNCKEVYPEAINTSNDNWLLYTIHFQNTGTAGAQHINIIDTLDINIEEESFQLLNYSHQPFTQINGNIINFNFPYINLPDSASSEPNSHGYIQYKVQLKSGIHNGFHIQNTAYIYFDFNPPLATNTVSTLVSCVKSTHLNTTICFGESYLFAGNLLTLPGNYTDTIKNSVYCDTIIYLNLNVLNQNINIDTMNNLLYIQSSGTYQWYNCDSNSVITGQTSSQFTPTVNGNYAAIIINGSCVDTSYCIYVAVTGINENNHHPFFFYPNPVKNVFCVNSFYEVNAQVFIYDLSGRVVLEKAVLMKKNTYIDVSGFSKGIYIVKVITPTTISRSKFWKE